MTFGEPNYLYVLLLVPALGLFSVWAAGRWRSAMARLGDPALIDMLSTSIDWRGRRLRTWLWFFAFVLVVIGLSRPQWGTEVQAIERQGTQVMVVLDVSKSMLAEDIKPSRLSRAKFEITDLLGRLKGDEVGLVLFSGASFLQFALNFDYATARTFVEGANPDLISRQGTAIADAIATALAGFDDTRLSQKVIVIMTDGESHEGDAVAAARRASEDGAIIYTMGFGSPQGEPIPEYDSRGEVVGYKQDLSGNPVLSRLDEVILQEIAREASGKYYRAGADSRAVEDLVSELDGLQKSTIEGEIESRKVERFPGFLLFALIALVVMELIPERKRTGSTFGWMRLRGPGRLGLKRPW